MKSKKQAMNPYLPGWEYVPDGEPHVFGDRVYVYGSHDRAFGTAYCQDDYTVWSAPVDDLGNWTCHGVTYRKDQDPHNQVNQKELWAPDVCRGTDGRYYLYYCCAFVPEIGIAVADVPEGPFTFYDYVRDEKGQIWDKDLPFDPGILFEDPEHIWLYTGFGSKPITLPIPDDMPFTLEMAKQIPDLAGVPEDVISGMMLQVELLRHPSEHCSCLRLAPDMKTVIASTGIAPTQNNAQGTDFEGHAFFEASSIRKVGDTYYFVYSSQLGHELCYATSKYPDRDFVYGGVIVSNGDLGYRGNTTPRAYHANNHGGMVKIKDQWYIFYHRHTNGTQFSRQGCAEKITILPDGSIPQVEITSCGLNDGPLKAAETYSAVICCNIAGPNGAGEIGMPDPGEKREIPMITEEGTGTDQVNQYLTNFTAGAWCGIKYLSFAGEKAAKMVLRGEGSLQLLTDGENGKVLATVSVSSEDWTEVTCSFDAVEGVHSVFMKGVSGKIDFSEISFIA